MRINNAIRYYIQRLCIYRIIMQSLLVLTVGGFMYTVLIQYHRLIAILTFILLLVSIFIIYLYSIVKEDLIIEIESLIETMNIREVVDFACEFGFKIRGNYMQVYNKYIDLSYIRKDIDVIDE